MKLIFKIELKAKKNKIVLENILNCFEYIFNGFTFHVLFINNNSINIKYICSLNQQNLYYCANLHIFLEQCKQKPRGESIGDHCHTLYRYFPSN